MLNFIPLHQPRNHLVHQTGHSNIHAHEMALAVSAARSSSRPDFRWICHSFSGTGPSGGV